MRTLTTIVFSSVLIFASVTYFNFTVFFNNTTSAPFLLLVLSVIAVIIYLWIEPTLPITKFELTIILLILYNILSTVLSGHIDMVSFAKSALVIPLYFGIKSYLQFHKISYYSKLLFWNSIIILSTALVITIYSSSMQKINTAIDPPNTSILSILLSAQIAFFLPLYYHYKKPQTRKLSIFFRCSIYLIIFLSTLLLIQTNGRSGWVGGFLAILHILYFYQNRRWLKRQLILFSAFSIVLLFPLLIWFKPGSTNGRVLIYKISAKMYSENWLWGIGSGQFKAKYNEYQAKYFAVHSIDSKEALLADDSFYLFNDFFQILIENGIIGFLLLLASILLLFHHIKKTFVTSDNKHLFTAATASLICIATGSLFSYALQIFPVMFHAILCLAILNSFQPGENIATNLSKKNSIISKIILFSLSILLSIHFTFYYNYKTKSYQAFEFNRTGFKQKAFEIYKELNNAYIKDGHVQYFYARELYYRNQLQEALQVLEKAKIYYCNHDLYKLSAAIENELQNFKEAENNYKTAIYMVPNRMISRYNLLHYYLERKDSVNAIYWANSIMNMPVKVPSKITENIHQKTRINLLQLSK